MKGANVLATPFLERLRASRWHRWLALITLGCMISLFSAAASHHHANDADDQDCAICSVVIHPVASTASVAPRPLVFFVQLYCLDAARRAPANVFARVPTPPICGPPRAQLI